MFACFGGKYYILFYKLTEGPYSMRSGINDKTMIIHALNLREIELVKLMTERLNEMNISYKSNSDLA